MYMWISTRPPRHPCLCSYLWYTRTVAPPLQGVVIKLWQKKKKKKNRIARPNRLQVFTISRCGDEQYLLPS